MSSGYVYGVPLTPEREKELIEKIAQWTVKYSMETPTIIFLQSVKPIGRTIGALGVFYGSAFMGLSPGISQYGMEAVSLFDNPDNIEKIISRIEELSLEKQRAEEEAQLARGQIQSGGVLKRLKRFFLGR
ncbi:MAG: hypothetical protein QXI32_05615 [Candidatus Bathyarchaeia archaeon]